MLVIALVILGPCLTERNHQAQQHEVWLYLSPQRMPSLQNTTTPPAALWISEGTQTRRTTDERRSGSAREDRDSECSPRPPGVKAAETCIARCGARDADAST